MDEFALPARRDNGLRADSFVALADVDPRLGDHLLDLLRLAEIAAYLEPSGDPRLAIRYRIDGPLERLFVQAELRAEARDVLLDAAQEAGASDINGAVATAPPARPDVLADIDTDAEFERLIAGLNVTPAPLTAAETAPAAESAGAPAATEDDDYDADDHFLPPAPPPFPVPRANTVGAAAVFLFGLLILIRGTWLGLDGSASFPIGIVLILLATGLFVRGLRDTDPEDAEPDDGAIV